MPAGRPTKYNEERAEKIIQNLRMGGTRHASAEAGIDFQTFLNWLRKYSTFSTSVSHAEAEAELLNAGVLKKAAYGYDVQEVTRTTKTVFKVRKTKMPDGSIVEEPVAMQETTEATTTRREFDWRAAESWLKRRRRDEWGDNIDVRKLTTEQIVEALDREFAGRTDPEERTLARLGPGNAAADTDR